SSRGFMQYCICSTALSATPRPFHAVLHNERHHAHDVTVERCTICRLPDGKRAEVEAAYKAASGSADADAALLGVARRYRISLLALRRHPNVRPRRRGTVTMTVMDAPLARPCSVDMMSMELGGVDAAPATCAVIIAAQDWPTFVEGIVTALARVPDALDSLDAFLARAEESRAA